MHEKNGIVELTDTEARLANYRPRFPLGEIPRAISAMRRRQTSLQAQAEDGWPAAQQFQARPISRHAFQLGELIDKLQRLR